MKEEKLYSQLLETADRVSHLDAGGAHPVSDYASLAREESWQQKYCAASRSVEDALRDASGSVWSDAIERCLAERGSVYFPKAEVPYYIDRPIVLKSGDRLLADPAARITLITAEKGGCLLRNASMVCSQEGPVAHCAGADSDIVVEGGIWSDQLNEGRGRGGMIEAMYGSMGAIVLSNVERVAVRNASFHDCSAYGLQICNARDFVAENLRFDETADGVHVNGPSANGIIRRLSGKTNDDIVALIGWDWDWATLTYGSISDVLVEDVESLPGYTWSEARLLPGTKVFRSGEKLACDIDRCIFRNIRGLHTYKLYDQPNLRKPEEDYADPIGRMSEIYFSDIEVDAIPISRYYDTFSDAVFDICLDIGSISFSDVRLNYTPGEEDLIPYLVSVGPKSLNFPRATAVSGPKKLEVPEDADEALKGQWKEAFNPEACPVVQDLRIRDVYLPDPDSDGRYLPCTDISKLVHERTLTLNPDFPNTMPRGGTGTGRIVRLDA